MSANCVWLMQNLFCFILRPCEQSPCEQHGCGNAYSVSQASHLKWVVDRSSLTTTFTPADMGEHGHIRLKRFHPHCTHTVCPSSTQPGGSVAWGGEAPDWFTASYQKLLRAIWTGTQKSNTYLHLHIKPHIPIYSLLIYSIYVYLLLLLCAIIGAFHLL